jgi:hypothetical protein
MNIAFFIIHKVYILAMGPSLMGSKNMARDGPPTEHRMQKVCNREVQLLAASRTPRLSIPAIDLFRYPSESVPGAAMGAKGSIPPKAGIINEASFRGSATFTMVEAVRPGQSARIRISESFDLICLKSQLIQAVANFLSYGRPAPYSACGLRRFVLFYYSG